MEGYVTYLQTFLAILTFYLLFKNRNSKTSIINKKVRIILISAIILSLLIIIYLILNNNLLTSTSIEYVDYFRYSVLLVWIIALIIMLTKRNV